MGCLLIVFLFTVANADQNVVNLVGNPSWVPLLSDEMRTSISEAEKEKDNKECDTKAATEQEKVTLIKKEKFHSRSAELFKKNPQVKDQQVRIKMYPELQILLDDFRKESAKLSVISEALHRCWDAPSPDAVEAEVDVFEAPDEKSKKIGKLKFSYRDSLYVSFVDTEEKYHPLSIDVHDTDSSVAYHTVLEKKGDWLKLPRSPFPKDVWIRMPGAGQRVRAIDRFGVLEVNTPTYSGGVVLDKIEGGFYVGRREDDHFDNPCIPGNKKTKTPKMGTLRIPIQELFDQNQHIRAKIKYTRGC